MVASDGKVSRAGYPQKTIGRYDLYGPISAGGMASVHFGRLRGSVGFSRTVAIKRLHPSVAADPDAVTMFLDEARIAARIHHPNVVGMLDVTEVDSEVFLVMDYVAGVSLSALVHDAEKTGARMPPEHAVAIMVGALHGLHAAHEAKNSAGESLAIVHRDVSPQNILVGEEGVARVIDFGIAKARERAYATQNNDLRGKVLYMAPEQLARAPVDRRTDLYSAAVVLWELLTGRYYVDAPLESQPGKVQAVLERRPSPPSEHVTGIPLELDRVLVRALARNPADRYPSALELATALELAISPASQREVAEWVSHVAGATLRERAEALRAIESSSPWVDLLANDHSTPALATTIAPPPPATSHARANIRSPLFAVAVFAGVLASWVLVGRGDPQLALRQATEEPRQGAGAGASPALPSFWMAPAGGPAVQPKAPALAAPVADSAPTDRFESKPGFSPTTHSATPAISPTPQALASPARMPPSRPPSASSRSRPSCNPPYTMDHGIRVPKRECL